MFKEIGRVVAVGGLLFTGCTANETPGVGETIKPGVTEQSSNVNSFNTFEGPGFKITKLSKDVIWIQGTGIRTDNIRGGLRFINDRCKILNIADLGSEKSGYGGSLSTTIAVVVDDGECIPEIEPWK